MTNDDQLAEKIRMIANHGQSKKYYHDIVGCNSRLDNIQAAVLRIKLKELNNYLENRKKSADYYDQYLGKLDQIDIPYRVSNSSHVFHQYTLKLKNEINRDKIIKFLADLNIPSMIYYPVPAHSQKMFADTKSENELEITEWLSKRVFSIPMHSELSQDQQDYIIEGISNFFKN